MTWQHFTTECYPSATAQGKGHTQITKHTALPNIRTVWPYLKWQMYMTSEKEVKPDFDLFSSAVLCPSTFQSLNQQAQVEAGIVGASGKCSNKKSEKRFSIQDHSGPRGQTNRSNIQLLCLHTVVWVQHNELWDVKECPCASRCTGFNHKQDRTKF